MKKLKVLLILIIFLSAGSVFQVINAQDKTKADQEKEAKLQQSIDQQKKALELQRKAKEKSELELMDSRIELDSSMKDMQIQLDDLDKPGSQMKVYRNRGNRAYSIDAAPFVWAGPEGGFEYFGHGFGGDENRTTWDFSKSVKENTFTRDYTFDVEKTVNNVVMSVMGDCKAGDIHIKIIMPNGKSYSDIIIDEFGNLNWRKSFSISETENQDKTGEWKFQIASNKATGFFKISLQTY